MIGYAKALKIQKELKAAIEYCTMKRDAAEESFNETDSQKDLELIAFYNGKLAGFEEFMRIFGVIKD